MKITTAGFDTHFWGPDGRAHPISPSHAAIPADKAAEYNAILLELLSGGQIRVKNPTEEEVKKAEKRWSEKSKAKIGKLIQEFPLKERYDMVKRALKEAGFKNLPASSTGLAVVFYNEAGNNSIASFSINTGNQKTGPSSATNATQASCPNGTNNASGYRCPLLGSGCYAEDSTQRWVTLRLNKAAGFNPKKDSSSKIAPEEIAAAEAVCLDAGRLTWEAIRINNGVRVHVVGDCVTSAAARTLSRALESYVEPQGLSGIGAVSDSYRKNVWNYTHAWREVPRSAWSPHISVLASCDRLEDLEDAAGQGYAPCVVVPDYVQSEAGKYTGRGMPLKNGWTLLPCPYEVGKKNAKDERVWCISCGICLKDDFLRSKRLAVAFAAHTEGSKVVANELIQIEEAIRK